MKPRLRTSLLFTAVLVMVGAASSSGLADDILASLDRLARSKSDSVDRSLAEAIAEQMPSAPPEVTSRLIEKLKDPTSPEEHLTVYVWAVGLSGNRAAVDELIHLHKTNPSKMVTANCLRALGAVGGKAAGQHLLSTLDNTTDEEMRFNLLNLLAQMQHEEALPRTEEVLRADPQQFFWQPIFVFGKMGDKAIPFLLAKIDDTNLNVRINATILLGQWLIAPEAAKPIEAQFWKEDNQRLRQLQLSCLEKTVPDLAQLKSILEQVTAKEKDAKLAKFAREAIDMIDQSRFAPGAQTKKISSEAFQKEYAQLFKSAGKKGSYEILRDSSSVADEPKLKALRERVLQRDSDEAFHDYQKVNSIIMLNRILKK